MLHAGDLDGILAGLIEEQALISATQPKTGLRRFEPSYIARPVGQVAINAMENLQGSVALDCAQIGAAFRRPDDCDPLRVAGIDHWLSPNSCMISSCGTFPTGERSTGELQRRGCFRLGSIGFPLAASRMRTRRR
jgi:hypothetical protein